MEGSTAGRPSSTQNLRGAHRGLAVHLGGLIGKASCQRTLHQRNHTGLERTAVRCGVPTSG